mgnify:CR=1 FL=1
MKRNKVIIYTVTIAVLIVGIFLYYWFLPQNVEMREFKKKLREIKKEVINQGSIPALPVKMSDSGICHEPGSTYYSRTKKYTPYDTLEECLDDGGRLPLR